MSISFLRGPNQRMLLQALPLQNHRNDPEAVFVEELQSDEVFSTVRLASSNLIGSVIQRSLHRMCRTSKVFCVVHLSLRDKISVCTPVTMRPSDRDPGFTLDSE